MQCYVHIHSSTVRGVISVPGGYRSPEIDPKNTAGLNTDAMNQRTVSLNKKHSLYLLTKDMKKNVKAATYKDAEAYCKQKKCGSKQALADNPAWKEHISHTALTRRLKGEVTTGSEWSANAVLTGMERRELAASLNSAGRQMCEFNLAERNQAIVDILLYRQALNKRPESGGRAYKKLSQSREWQAWQGLLEELLR